MAHNMFKWLDIISIWIIYLNHRKVTEERDKRPRADCLDLREYKEKRQKGDKKGRDEKEIKGGGKEEGRDEREEESGGKKGKKIEGEGRMEGGRGR